MFKTKDVPKHGPWTSEGGASSGWQPVGMLGGILRVRVPFGHFLGSFFYEAMGAAGSFKSLTPTTFAERKQPTKLPKCIQVFRLQQNHPKKERLIP